MLETWTLRILSVLRIIPGLALLQHGTGKWMGGSVVPNFANVTLTPSGVAGVRELSGGLLFILGPFTRPVAFLLSGLCAVAHFFLAHAPRGFYPILNGGELAALYAFVYFPFAGAGPWSGDAVLARTRAFA